MSIDWEAFWLTLQLAAVVSAILLVLGLSLAYWIAFSRWRWKFLVEAAVALPIVIGSILYSLPFAVQPFAASFSSVDRKLMAASATLGASRFRTFSRVPHHGRIWRGAH